MTYQPGQPVSKIAQHKTPPGPDHYSPRLPKFKTRPVLQPWICRMTLRLFYKLFARSKNPPWSLICRWNSPILLHMLSIARNWKSWSQLLLLWLVTCLFSMTPSQSLQSFSNCSQSLGHCLFISDIHLQVLIQQPSQHSISSEYANVPWSIVCLC
jgi:hypothetical protein